MGYFGKVLKQLMKQRKLTVKDIAKATKLSINSIKNLINNRSRKMEYIEIIADTYKVPIEYFTTLDSIIVNISCYSFATSIVSEVMHTRNVSEAPKELITSFIESAYDYLYADNKSISECRNYIAGMVEHAIFIGQLVRDY
ncbi:MAG: Helix-turn-helix domain [Rickettsiaceae bacterium]|jgi:transcriptional regulator with XRE-family HTH domain|nr:Helix-turn-helix domain [Rickettsiaceae bacterium]